MLCAHRGLGALRQPDGAPISSVIAVAMSSRRFSYSATIRSSSAMRASRRASEKVLKASRAALTARSTSAAELSEMRPQTASVAGLMGSFTQR